MQKITEEKRFHCFEYCNVCTFCALHTTKCTFTDIYLLSIPGRQQKDIGNHLQADCETLNAISFQLSHTESAEYQIFLTFEKYCVPCENKVHGRFFF